MKGQKKMIRFAMCGTGGFIEKAVLPMMQKTGNAEAIAAFDVDRERVERVSRDFGIERTCSSFEELLSVPGLDAVYIASPNALHKDQAIAAASSGKHVFCQKPLGITAADCQEMITACKDNGVKLGVGFCYRFSGSQIRTKELMEEGAIGEVSHLHFSFNLGCYTPETVGWRCDARLSGGGPLMDVAPHIIDLAYFLTDKRVESVMAYVSPERSDTEIETDAQVLLQCEDGVKVSIDTSFVRINVPYHTVIGSKGHIHSVGTMPWLTNGTMPGTLTMQIYGEDQPVAFSTDEHIEQEIRLYCEAIEKDEEPPVSGEAGLYTQSVIEAIYESGRTGSRVKLPQPVASSGHKEEGL